MRYLIVIGILILKFRS